MNEAISEIQGLNAMIEQVERDVQELHKRFPQRSLAKHRLIVLCKKEIEALEAWRYRITEKAKAKL